MAYVRANLFYEREQWKKPVLLSVGFHGLLVLSIVVWAYVAQSHSTANDWGTNRGEAVEAQLVSSAIPIPRPAQPTENIVANDSKGVTQTQPEVKPVEKPPDDAVPIQGKVKPPKVEKPVQQAHVTQPPRPVPTPETAVPFGDRGPVSGPYGSISTPKMNGGVSVQESSFGDKYPFYIKQIRDIVQSSWRQWEIDPSIKAPHRAFVEFEIRRDGSVNAIQVAQSSGVPSLDISATRTLKRIENFGALPEGTVLHVQIWFDYPPK